jgi:PST family polysaccharide transporter
MWIIALLDRMGSVRGMLTNGLKSTVSKNILSLYGIQFANYVLPLITVPYLVRILGPDKFGAIAFGQGLMNYFILIVNYGFDWSATREIAIQRNNQESVSKIAINVWTAKSLLCLLSFVILFVLIKSIPKMREVGLILYILYGMVIGNALFPTWLFQGLERIVALSSVNFVARILSTGGIFLIVKYPSDFEFYACLISFQWIFSGLLALIIAFRFFGLRFAYPNWDEVKKTLTEGWSIFLTTGAISLYTAGNAFILGLLTNNSTVGFYSAAEKLVRSALQLLRPISQAVYPRFSKMALISRVQTLRWGRSVLLVMSTLGLILSVSLLIGAPLITKTILGPEFLSSTNVLRVLAVLPFIVAVSNLLGVQILFPFHKEKAVLMITSLGGVLNLFLALFLVPKWKAPGMALAVAAGELFVTVSYFVYCSYHGLNPIWNVTGDEFMREFKSRSQSVQPRTWLLPRLLLHKAFDLIYQVKFFAEFGFFAPPSGTDMSGYDKLLRFVNENNLLNVDGDFVEIGAFLGGGSYKLANFLKRKKCDKKLYSVDVFELSIDQTVSSAGIAMSDLYERRLNRSGKGLSQYEIFTKVTSGCKNLIVIKGDSKQISIPVREIAFGFVDGNHEASYVENDFYLVWNKLSAGGVIAFDDYEHDLPQVTRTIDLLLRKHKEEMAETRIIDKVIFIKKKNNYGK